MYPEYFSVENGYAAFRPKGQFTFNQAVKAVDEAVAFCRDNKIRGLLVDITGMAGFPPPNTSERFQFATQWASTAGGSVILSIVSPPEMIDYEKIGITIARNRGLAAEVFTMEPDAIDWLVRTCDKT
jgi:hypothetical protein